MLLLLVQLLLFSCSLIDAAPLYILQFRCLFMLAAPPYRNCSGVALS
jgi:hypothetical protein